MNYERYDELVDIVRSLIGQERLEELFDLYAEKLKIESSQKSA